MTYTNNSIFILEITLIILVTEMLTILKSKPRLVRVQHNSRNGLYFLTIPLETIHECNWEPGDNVKFTMIDENHLELERVGG